MNSSSPKQNVNASAKFSRKTVNVSRVHSNTALEVIEITTDKLRILLTDHIKKSEKLNEWQTALGVFLAAIATLVTTEFKTAFGVDGGVWKAIFIITSLFSFVWFLKGLVGVYRAESVDKLISRIKNDPQE